MGLIEFDTKGNDFAPLNWTMTRDEQNREIFKHDLSELKVTLEFNAEGATYLVTAEEGRQLSSGTLPYVDMESFKDQFIFQGGFWKTIGKSGYYGQF